MEPHRGDVFFVILNAIISLRLQDRENTTAGSPRAVLNRVVKHKIPSKDVQVHYKASLAGVRLNRGSAGC